MSYMEDGQLNTAAFVFYEEIKSWKSVKFDWNKHAAVNKSGETIMFASEDDLSSHVKRCAVRAILRFYHGEQAKVPTPARNTSQIGEG